MLSAGTVLSAGTMLSAGTVRVSWDGSNQPARGQPGRIESAGTAISWDGSSQPGRGQPGRIESAGTDRVSRDCVGLVGGA